MKTLRSPIIRTLQAALLVLLLSGFGSRRPAAVQMCADVPVQFDSDVQAALTELSGGRKLASTSRAFKGVRLSEPDRKLWLKWAEVKISEAQHALDLAETDPKLRASAKELTQLSTRLVEFHGYAQGGNLQKMLTTLEKVRKYGQKAGNSACKPL